MKKAEDATTLADMKAAYAELEKAMAEYEAEFPVKLSIDTAKTVQTIEPDSIFGINHRYAFNGYGTFDSKEMKMKDEFTKLYEQADLDLSVIRRNYFQLVQLEDYFGR